ncbi:MAG: hypothetical protein WCY29_13270 [Novosphingobium sp.]
MAGSASYERAREHWRRGSYRMLTRTLLGAGKPQDRFQMSKRRHCPLPPPTERRHAGRGRLRAAPERAA